MESLVIWAGIGFVATDVPGMGSEEEEPGKVRTWNGAEGGGGTRVFFFQKRYEAAFVCRWE